MSKLKFGWMPGHWGLVGKTREIAKAEYELTGFDLERRLLELRKDEMNDEDYTRKSLDLNFKYEKLSRPEYNRALLTLIHSDKQRTLAEAKLDLDEGKIGHIEYSKKTATLKGEPWVTVVNMDFATKNSLEGSFELDWNDAFVEKLKGEGYAGPTSDNIVNQWFMEVCRNVAMEEFDGTGDFTSDSEANLDAMKRWSSEQVAPGKKAHR